MLISESVNQADETRFILLMQVLLLEKKKEHGFSIQSLKKLSLPFPIFIYANMHYSSRRKILLIYFDPEVDKPCCGRGLCTCKYPLFMTDAVKACLALEAAYLFAEEKNKSSLEKFFEACCIL